MHAVAADSSVFASVDTNSMLPIITRTVSVSTPALYAPVHSFFFPTIHSFMLLLL